MPGRTLIVLNTRSGHLSARQKLDELSRALAHHRLTPDIRTLDAGSQVAAAVTDGARQGYETIVVGGGDGTLSAAASALAGTDRRMGVLPLGTFNYFARNLGIPGDIAAATGVLAQGRDKWLDLGEVNGRTFLNNASLGVYARVLERREDLYRRWGRSRIAAHVSVLLSLARARAPLSLHVTVDGATESRRTPMIFIANNPFQLNRFRLAGTECLKQGCLAIYIAPACGPAALLRLATRLALGRLRPERDFELLCGTDILVETKRSPRHVVRDGERDLMPSPYRFRICRRALRVIAPCADPSCADTGG
ncbi:MAG TPA: diacylglycerol kinase family protein [Rhodopila sp.]|nr:diacylglycerol kinase family protein [Rhodopila sp.]